MCAPGVRFDHVIRASPDYTATVSSDLRPFFTCCFTNTVLLRVCQACSGWMWTTNGNYFTHDRYIANRFIHLHVQQSTEVN